MNSKPWRRLASKLENVQLTSLAALSAVCLLVLLMHYWLAGEIFHEWVGIFGILAAALHFRQFSWWLRTVRFTQVSSVMLLGNIITSGLLLSAIVTALSGVAMSREALPMLRISGMHSTLALIHLSASHWMFLFAALHCGHHGKRLFGSLTKALQAQPATKFFTATLALAAVVCACFTAHERSLLQVLTWQVEFLNMDAEKPALFLTLETLGLFVATASVAAFARSYLRPRRITRTRASTQFSTTSTDVL